MIFVVFMILIMSGGFCTDIDLNLQATEAILYSNNQVVLKFKIGGGVGEKELEYIGIPTDWIPNKHDLVISNFTLGVNQEWSFQIKITDDDDNFFRQTIKVVFAGFNVEITPVTLSQKGNQRVEGQPTEDESFDFNEIISRYPGIENPEEQSNYGFQQNKNNVPQIIANASTEYDPRNKGLSEEDARRNAALQRQLNANKIIANLLNVIKQLTSLINRGARDVEVLQNQTDKKQEDSKTCQEEQFSLEDVRAKIINAVNDKKSRLKQYDQQVQNNEKILRELQQELSQYKQQRQTIEKKDVPNNKELQQLQEKIKTCERTVTSGKGRIEEILQQVNKNRAQISLLQLEIKQSKDRVQQLSRDLTIIRSKIEDLRQQLLQAEKQQDKIMKDKSYYDILPLEGEKKIRQLEFKNNQLYQEISILNSSTEKRIEQCQDFKKELKRIRETLALSELNYKTLAKLIEDKQTEVNQRKQTIDFFRGTAATLPIELAGLEVELQKYQDRIKTQKYLCYVAQQEYRRVQQSLKATQNQYDQNVKLLRAAERNLDEAKVEKEFADQAVQEFSEFNDKPVPSPSFENIVPRATFLDESFTLDVISESPVNIGNLGLYISEYLKVSVNPANYANTETYLYPLDEISRKKLVGSLTRPRGLSSFPCQNSPQKKSFQGTFERVSIGTIVLRTNKLYTLSISRCTKISSTDPEIFFKRGVKVYFSGKELFSLGGTTLFDVHEILFVDE